MKFSEERMPDLGLDALDILDVTDKIVAFSTEIDDPYGRFTAGDLLLTTGAAIPNIALVHVFDISADVGLDAVQFMGERDQIVAFVSALGNLPRDAFLDDPTLLQRTLKEYKLDIWFSIEGTWGPAAAPTILDGDLLSALGAVVAKQQTLLPPSTPAGIPSRGVDFGLDAIRTERIGTGEQALARLHFSTEILFAEKATITDGDEIKFGNGVATTNAVLVSPFQPAAKFLGLDALSPGKGGDDIGDRPMITMIGSRSVWNIGGGAVSPMGTGSGLYVEPPGPEPQRPFGMYVPIDGFLPNDVTEFRVAFRENGTPRPAPNTASGINTTWQIQNAVGPICAYNATYSDDGSGWFTHAEYVQHRFIEPCLDGGVVLAVWDTLGDPNVTDENGHYIVWLEWRTTAGGATVYQEPLEHHVQLDNEAPTITKLELETSTGTSLGACDEASGVEKLRVYAEFDDNYFGGYRLRLGGGDPPVSTFYPSPATWHSYWEGIPEVVNLDPNGTQPTGSKFLREIDLNDLGGSFVDCCYEVDLWVNDRAIRHSFWESRYAWPTWPPWAWPHDFLTFAAEPPP